MGSEVTLGKQTASCLARGENPIKEGINLHLSVLTCKMGNKI